MKGSEDLKANAQKALKLKTDAGPQTKVPEHETAHDGPVGEGQVGYTDTSVGKEPTSTPNLKRSHVARNGDGS